MKRAEAHLPSYGFFCWCCVHLGCKISFDVSCADDMTGKQAGIELCAAPFFRRAFQVYDTLDTVATNAVDWPLRYNQRRSWLPIIVF